MPLLTDNIVSTNNNDDYGEYSICNNYDNPNIIHCDNWQECYDVAEIHSNNTNGTVGCTGFQSCSDVSNVLLNGTNGIRCDAPNACSWSTITLINGGNAYATAAVSAIVATITGTSESDIFCHGDVACEDTTMTTLRNLYVTGFRGCRRGETDDIYENEY